MQAAYRPAVFCKVGVNVALVDQLGIGIGRALVRVFAAFLSVGFYTVKTPRADCAKSGRSSLMSAAGRSRMMAGKFFVAFQKVSECRQEQLRLSLACDFKRFGKRGIEDRDALLGPFPLVLRPSQDDSDWRLLWKSLLHQRQQIVMRWAFISSARKNRCSGSVMVLRRLLMMLRRTSSFRVAATPAASMAMLLFKY